MKTFGVKGLPNKEYWEVIEKGKTIYLSPQDYYSASFTELKNLGLVFSPKEYKFSSSTSKKKEIEEILSFYTKQTEKISGSFLKVKRELEDKIGHLDMQIIKDGENIICVDPHMLVGSKEDIEKLSKDMITCSLKEIKGGVRIIYSPKNKTTLF
mgnify:CR=1 FL=1